MICWIFQTWFLKFADKDIDDVDSTRVRDDGDDYQQSNGDEEEWIERYLNTLASNVAKEESHPGGVMWLSQFMHGLRV